jgi:hypothetical protein
MKLFDLPLALPNDYSRHDPQGLAAIKIEMNIMGCGREFNAPVTPTDAPKAVRMKPRKIGRPRIEDRAKTNEAKKPWLKLNMSRRTWYRRQAEKRKGRE